MFNSFQIGGHFLQTCRVLLYKLGYVTGNGTIINASPEVHFGALELKILSSHERIGGAISDIENPKVNSDNDAGRRFQSLLRRVSVKKDKTSKLSLNLIQSLKLRFLGQAYIGHRIRPGWNGSLPFYAFECQRHARACQNEDDFLRSFLALKVGGEEKEESDVASQADVVR